MSTIWEVKSNIVYEMCCFLNTLCVGLPYSKYYAAERTYWLAKLMADGKIDSLKAIKRLIYTERRQIISSELCLYFSIINDEDPEVKDVLKINSKKLIEMRKTERFFWVSENWDAFVTALPEIKKVFKSLLENGFVEYFDSKHQFSLSQKCKAVKEEIREFDIISPIEDICKKEFTNNKVKLYICHFTLPHGMKLYGNRFIGMSTISTTTLAWLSLHEMIHTPYRYDKGIRDILESMKKNSKIGNAVMNHEKWIGYNTFESYFNEQCTKALDHFLGEKIGVIPNDAVGSSVIERARKDDGGIHILFPRIYRLLKMKYDYSESFQEFIVRMYRETLLM